MSFNIWEPKGTLTLTGPTGGASNPNVIYEGNPQILAGPNVFKMWCGAIQGGTGIWYFESADGITSWTVHPSNPVIASAATNSFPTVYKVGSTYYCYHGAFPGGAGIYVRTSADGITWGSPTLAIPIGVGVWEATGVAQLNLVPGTPGFGTGTGETYYAYYEGVGSSGSAMILATSTDLIVWTKGDVANPIFQGVAPLTFQKIGSTYYAWGPNGSVPASVNPGQTGMAWNAITRWSATAPGGPWTSLKVPGSLTQPAAVIHCSIRADFDISGTNTNIVGANISDPYICVALGNLYVYWTRTTFNGVQSCINMAKATGVTPAQQVNGYEGMLNFPMPMFDGNLTVLGTDPGTGTNANPIGGNWTKLLVGTENQRASNVIESAAAPGNGISWYNTPTFPDDMWSEITCHSTAGGSVLGALTRMNKSGTVNSDYIAYWVGNTGNLGTCNLAKTVTGTGTTLGSLNGKLKISADDKLMLVTSGTNLLIYYNGFPIMAATDASLASGAPGLWNGPAATVGQSQIGAWRGGGFQSGWEISGSAGVAGATVSYTSSLMSGSVTADGSGNYAITGIFDDTYTVIPSKTGYSFTPNSLSEVLAGASITGADFTAGAVTGTGIGRSVVAMRKRRKG